MRKGRILVVDDSLAIRREVSDILRDSGEFETTRECEDGFAALRAMAETRPDVVVCDLVMPGCDGITLLRMRAAKSELVQIPVLMLTSAGDQEKKVDLLERGAADYITKPFHRGELLARVRIHYRLRVLTEELEEANQRLYTLSCTDGLTGLFNRRHLDRILEAEVSRHHRYGIALTLILIDVDHFKGVNDAHGHLAGDAVLQRIADTVQAMTRKADVAARYGGEEMCLVLTSTGIEGAMILAERLRQAIEELAVDYQGVTSKPTASVGVAEVDGAAVAGGASSPSGKRLSVAELLERADKALFAAKARGRNRVVAWSEELG